jgi:hypothetical protein
MPAKIVDLSARSSIIEAEPFGLHFWECTPQEFLDYLRDPRGFLASMGIKLPKKCRIETTIENHDWLSQNTRKLTARRARSSSATLAAAMSRWRAKSTGS